MTEFRDIPPSDTGAILQMMQDFYAIDGYPFDKPKAATLLQHFLENESLGKAWGIVQDNETAGYLILTFIFSFEFGGRIAFVDELYIKNEYRGKGLGKKAIAFAQEKMRELDLQLLYLEVEPHNAKAMSLYRSAGFSAQKRNLLYYKP